MILSTTSLPLLCGEETNTVPSRPPYSQSISGCTLGSPPGPRALLTGMKTSTFAHSYPTLGPSGRARDVTAYVPLIFPKFHCSDSSISCCSFSALKQDCISGLYNSICSYSAWQLSKCYHLYCLISALNLNLL